MGEGIYSGRPEQRASKQNRSNGSAGKGANEVFLNPQFVVQNSRDVNFISVRIPFIHYARRQFIPLLGFDDP